MKPTRLRLLQSWCPQRFLGPPRRVPRALAEVLAAEVLVAEALVAEVLVAELLGGRGQDVERAKMT